MTNRLNSENIIQSLGSALVLCGMARPLRLEHGGAIWHVTSRGDARQPIFEDDEDRRSFLDILAHVGTMFRWRLYAYVLMGNHFHLLLETPEPNLSRGIRQLNGIYTQRFNRRHGRVGHLFQGRYKGILVERDSHLLELCRYIVLNPVRAGMARSAKDWKWSSYRSTAGLDERPGWLACETTLHHFGKRTGVAQAKYREFVREGLKSGYEPWTQLRGQIILGSEAFESELAKRIGARRHALEIPKRQRLLGRPTLAAIVREVSKAFGVAEECVENRKPGDLRQAIAYVARTEGTYSIDAIGARLGVQGWSASHLAATGARKLIEEPGFERKVRLALKRLG